MMNESGRGALVEHIESLLPLVEKPARYLGTEIGAIRKPWPDDVRASGSAQSRAVPPAARADLVKWLLILPDIYEIGMSHLGLRILYDILNRREDALAERAFAPWTDMDTLMRREGIPLFSLESRRPARDFDIVGFSVQYELLATNIINLLDLAGIPLLSRERGASDPLIAGGGPCTGNPEPLADFIDIFLIGDGEEAAGRITAVAAATRGEPREARLLALAQIPGVYVPRFYKPVYREGRQVAVEPLDNVPLPVRRTYLQDLDSAPYPERPVVPLIEAVQDRLTLEIQRGCTQGCRFCQAGIFYRPVRERSPGRLVELVATGLPASGWDEISLSSLSSADYAHIRPLAHTLTDALEPYRISLSLSSLRVDTFSVELADHVSRVRKTGLTFAPEAGSQRLREVINKRVTEDNLLQSVEAAYAKGWQHLKLYFMIGLPTETEADVEGIIALAGRVREIGRRHGGSRRVTISIGSFVPKAHTPFQWEPFGNREKLRGKLQHLRQRIQSPWSQVRWHSVDTSFIEAVISRGDRRLGKLLLRVWEQGARFDGWTDQFKIERWEEALRDVGIDPAQYTRAIEPHSGLPWDHIHLGVEKAWLLRERDRAFCGQATPDCRSAACTGCGLGCSETRSLAPELEPDDWNRLKERLSRSISDYQVRPSARAESGHHATATILAESITPEQTPGTIHRYRIVYAKTGRLRFISHLETGRLLARVFRMAGWPLAFSAGHHPHPRFGYGPPLPLGVEGERELIDVQLTDSLRIEHMERAKARAPEGLGFLEYRRLTVKPQSLAAATLSAEYRVEVPVDLYRQALIERRVAEFHKAGSVMALKASKGRQKTVDLKRCVRSLAWVTGSGPGEEAAANATGGHRDEAAARAVDGAGEEGVAIDGGARHFGGTLHMELLQREPSGHAMGPLPLLRELFKWNARDLGRCRVRRLHLLDDQGQPLDG